MRNFLFLTVLLQLIVSCAPLSQTPESDDLLIYLPSRRENTLLARFHPVFIIDEQHKAFNRIGTPRAELLANGEERVYIDPSEATVYTEVRTFKTANDTYTNLVYRIHFPETPFSLFPFQLAAGKNVGLIVIVTLNSAEQPVLYTTVHTCGCFLAFIPTTYLQRDAFPSRWPEGSQIVYGEALPARLDPIGGKTSPPTLAIMIRNASHRVKNLRLSENENFRAYANLQLQMQPMDSLERLPLKGSDRTTSLYETSGFREGFVKESHKPLEMILMSWWALDLRIGEDKKLSNNKNEPPIFYTSLKPWARDFSDMRDFPTFFTYWGWKL